MAEHELTDPPCREEPVPPTRRPDGQVILTYNATIAWPACCADRLPVDPPPERAWEDPELAW